ncbi:unnamed protein product [Spirodela intermedia]|uniref:Uncharacterized protein n=2 Tax=Spirodela intermedia TaxID=51605 RepID=A0A7I8JN03_SPIIN|nr:unnamed protein product [Spirodela intermedia]CAA6671547.1 unnamed protein product [Spirodela intermedia]CAA7408649.1 unnamed protein product [Spirodela intermedia]
MWSVKLVVCALLVLSVSSGQSEARALTATPQGGPAAGDGGGRKDEYASKRETPTGPNPLHHRSLPTKLSDPVPLI